MEVMQNSLLGVLSQEEKLWALREFSNSRLEFDGWVVFTFFCLVLMIGVVLLGFRFYQYEVEQQRRKKQFASRASDLGLTDREKVLLNEIALRSGIKDVSMIYNLPAAFDAGTEAFMQTFFSKSKKIDEKKKLYMMIVAVRNKLGIGKSNLSSTVRRVKSSSLSSRNIPLGKKLSISRKLQSDEIHYDVVIVESDDHIFRVSSDFAINAHAGETWVVRYRFGGARWEFESVIIDDSERSVIFHHSDNIRFVNRRRFLRVNTDYPAVIARFECSKMNQPGMMLTPDFRTARVLELSGPCVKIETHEAYRSRERVIVGFRIDDSTLIQDLGEVRRCESLGDMHMLVVEMIGLDEKSINRLVKATNHAALKYGLQFAHEEVSDNVLEAV